MENQEVIMGIGFGMISGITLFVPDEIAQSVCGLNFNGDLK